MVDFSGIFIASNGEAFGQPVVGFGCESNILNVPPFGLWIRSPLSQNSNLQLEGVVVIGDQFGVTFHGDVKDVLAGRNVWLNDVEHVINGEWYVDQNVTFATFSPATLVPGDRYVLEVR